jgi:hypothetical protein
VRRIEQAGRAWSRHPLPQIPPAGARAPAGIGGWLLIYVIGRAGLLMHQLQLTVGAIVIYADPGIAGLRTFVPVSAFLLYEVTNWLLVGLTGLTFVLMRKRRRAAIAANLVLSGLWLAILVLWHFLGLKSGAGTIIDATPAVFGVWYFLSSKRVKNTFTRAADAQQGSIA